MIVLLLACASDDVQKKKKKNGDALPITNGGGGPTGMIDTTWVDSQGREGLYAMDVPEDVESAEPYGLLVYFHADGFQRNYSGHLDKIRETADDHHLIPVSMQEPDKEYWWAPVVEANNAYVSDFVDFLGEEYPIDPNRVFFAGTSGGASFASGWHLLDGFRYRGGVAAMCGADIPRADVPNPNTFDYDADDPPAADVPADIESAVVNNIRFYMAIAKGDFLRELSENAAVFYEDLGFEVTHELLPGGGHCAFNQAEQIAIGMQVID